MNSNWNGKDMYTTFFNFYLHPKILNSFVEFFLLFYWLDRLKNYFCKNNTILFHSALFCDYQSKGHCKFFKSPWKVYFSSLWADFVKYGPDLYIVFIFHVLFLIYSLISIRQNYNFVMLANIWHEIVSWFLKIS